MTFTFSHRIDESPLNPIARETARLKAQGFSLSSLNDSNPTHFGLAPRLVPQTYLADPRGDLTARRALADFLIGADPDRLYLLSSTSEAYAWLFMLLCNPTDLVMGPKPGYPLIESIARLTGVEAIPYPLFYDGSWNIDREYLRRMIEDKEKAGRKVKALVLINPNNPTGSYLKAEERQEIIDLCQEHGVALIADEVFYDYALDPPQDRRRLAGEDQVLTFALGGLSKSLAAPHAKVGWIQVSGPRDEVAEAQRRLDVIADDFLPFSQFHSDALPSLLAEVPSQTEAVCRRIRGNYDALRSFLKEDNRSLLTVLHAEGGWNVLIRFPSTIDENELSQTLLDDFFLVSQPGYFFDMPSNGYTALSLLPERPDFLQKLQALNRAVNRLAW